MWILCIHICRNSGMQVDKKYPPRKKYREPAEVCTPLLLPGDFTLLGVFMPYS